MKTERDLFEDLPYIKSRLDDVFFIDEENTYLPHQWDDADSVNNMHFINGAWYSWQARVPEGYVVVPVIIAFVRGHESRWGIFLMTLFLGWTMLFWFWSLIWSVSAKGGSSNTINNIRNG